MLKHGTIKATMERILVIVEAKMSSHQETNVPQLLVDMSGIWEARKNKLTVIKAYSPSCQMVADTRLRT